MSDSSRKEMHIARKVFSTDREIEEFLKSGHCKDGTLVVIEAGWFSLRKLSVESLKRLGSADVQIDSLNLLPSSRSTLRGHAPDAFVVSILPSGKEWEVGKLGDRLV